LERAGARPVIDIARRTRREITVEAIADTVVGAATAREAIFGRRGIVTPNEICCVALTWR